MKKIFLAALLAIGTMAFSGYTGTANATAFDFNGNIAYQKDVVEIAFTLNSDATNVRVWTDSFQNATNFDPITAVWKQSGADFVLVGQNDDNATIAAGQTYYDSGLVFNSLAAGSYMFTIATFNNFANGTLLSQGFAFDNQTAVALADWTQPASHHGMGTYYDVRLDGVDNAINNTPVPEPGTMMLLGLGMAGLAVFGKRRANKK